MDKRKGYGNSAAAPILHSTRGRYSDSVLRHPATAPPQPQGDAGRERDTEGKGKRGRPKKAGEPQEKVLCVLLTRHVAFLDGLAAQQRARGERVDRSAILRALVDALQTGRISLEL